jgi:transposase
MGSKLQKIHSQAAGIDVGSLKFFVGVDDEEVRDFDTFTSGCQQVAEYLQQKGITTVAMEATGVYWTTLYDMLTAVGIEVFVVNGRHVKHVPGRKTDVRDCMWIKELHSYGLLRPSFIPPAMVREMRHYMRLREQHIEQKVTAVHRMDKALVMMNIRLSSVVSDLQGESSMRIIRAILEGERNDVQLLALCDVRILNKKAAMMKESLNGFYKEEQLFALQQAWEQYVFSGQQISQCDIRIEKLLQSLTADKPAPRPGKKPKTIFHNKPAINDLHKMVQQLYEGKDLTVLPGLTSYSLLKFFSVTGNDLSPWKDEKNFTAWLGLAPSKYQSGKSRKYKKIKVNTEGGQILRECVQPLLRSKHIALGQFGKRIAGRRGPAVAIKAMARKLACWIYRMVTKGMDFVENGIKQYEQQLNKQKIKWLQKQASALNLQLLPNNS